MMVSAKDRGSRRGRRLTMILLIDGGQLTSLDALKDLIWPALSRTMRATQASVSLANKFALLKRLTVRFLNLSWRLLRSLASGPRVLTCDEGMIISGVL